MKIDDINRTIAELTSLYDNVNQQWKSDPCQTDIYQSFRQEEYLKSYESLKNISFEGLMLSMLTNSLDDKILARLHSLIDDNIRIYEERHNEFSNIDLIEVLHLQAEHIFSDSLAILDNDRNIILDGEYPTEREKQRLLQENQKEKKQLESEKTTFVRSNIPTYENLYVLTYKHSKDSLSIIGSYFPANSSKPIQTSNDNITQSSYFGMGLISEIHKVCNNAQFENISEVDLYSALNLQPANTRLGIKPRETTRVCYLIHKLYQSLKTDDRKEWRTAILEQLEIKESLYKSKYKEPISDIPSRKSEEFAERIKRVF